MEQYAALMSGPYVRDAYDVTAMDAQLLGSDAESRRSATVTTLQVAPTRWDDVAAQLRSIATRVGSLRGSALLLLESRRGSRAVLVEIAAGREALGPDRDRVHAVVQELWRAGMLSGPPDTRSFDAMTGA